MTIETDLARSFGAHEDLAPDPEQVLAAVRTRTAGRRPVTRLRPWAIAATVTVMAAGASLAVVMASDGASPPSGVAGSPSAALTATPSVSSAAAIPVAVTMPFAVGWLPEGSADYLARRTTTLPDGPDGPGGPGVVRGEDLLTVTSPTRALDIDVAQQVGGLDGAAFKSGAGADVTVGGRPAVESSDASGRSGYEIYFLDAAEELVYVNVTNSTTGPARPAAPADELRATGRRIAASVVSPGSAPVTPEYGVRYVPDGLTLATFDVSAPTDEEPAAPAAGGSTRTHTGYAFTAAGSTHTALAIFVGTAPAGVPTTPGRPVQGHPTTLSDQDGYLTLVVAGADGGDAICLAAALPAEELYRVADGLVLPG